MSTVFRSLSIGCPENVVGTEPVEYVWVLVALMALQVVVIFLQEYVGPAFFPLQAGGKNPSTIITLSWLFPIPRIQNLHLVTARYAWTLSTFNPKLATRKSLG